MECLPIILILMKFKNDLLNPKKSHKQQIIKQLKIIKPISIKYHIKNIVTEKSCKLTFQNIKTLQTTMTY